MDRDPSANEVDRQDRSTLTDGRSPYGESGDQRARVGAERDPARDRPADDEGRELEHEDERRSDSGAAFPQTPLPPD